MQKWNDFISANTSLSEEATPACALVDLSDLGLIKVSGEDKETFLQGQLTNDVTKVSGTHSQMSSYCSPKGRMLANFRLFMRGDDIYIIIPQEKLEAILKRLRMFVLMSKVVLDDVSEELVCVGVVGDCTSVKLPTESDDVATEAGITSIRLAGDSPRALLVGDFESMSELWQSSGAAIKERSYWSLQDIRAGLPTVYEQTTEAFIPQMTNMQLINGVSFKKGCYTGQEVVARMQYLGKLKRRMFRVSIDTDTMPEPGTELFSASSASGQGAGKIVEASPSPDGGFEALAVAQISSAEADDLTLGSAEGPKLNLLDLPYSFEEQE